MTAAPPAVTVCSEILNQVLDRTLKRAPIIVKTCQYYIAAEGSRTPRHGRFTLDYEQHKQLTEENGLYLFIVLKEIGTPIVWSVVAADIPFIRQVSWTIALKRKKCGNIALENAIRKEQPLITDDNVTEA